MRKAIALLLAGWFIFSGVAAQDENTRQKAFLVKRMIELNHYSPRPVDDSFSLGLFNSLINIADHRRILFTAAEFKQLSSYSFKLDDELQGNGWAFLELFTAIYKRSLLRADSIITVALQQPFDFTANESIQVGRHDSWNFAATNADLKTRWLKYCKFLALENLYDDAISGGQKEIAKAPAPAAEQKARDKIRARERKIIKKIVEQPEGFATYVAGLYYNALANSFDPHTDYFSPEGKEVFQSALSTEGYSFGIEVEEDDKGNVVIGYLIPGGPAWRSGELNKGDQVQQLSWNEIDTIDITSLSAEEIEGLLEQTTNERVRLKVKKPDNSSKTVTLRREKINTQENIVRSFVLNGEKKIGYILLPGFYTQWENEEGSGCANDVAKEIIKLKRENIDGLILDVRFNGGGSINEGLELTGIFIDEGPLAAQKDKTGKVIYYKDPNRGVIYNGPMALMVNGQSASASEMLAASLQDYNRAVIVGSQTYGKATFQQMLPLDTTFNINNKLPPNTSDIVKITLGKFYRLDGQSIQRKGVRPDVALPDAFEGLDLGERFSKNALPADSVKKNNYYKPLPQLPVNELARKSSERIKNDDDFKAINALIATEESSRKHETEFIPLKWDEFQKWILSNMPSTGFADPIQSGKKLSVANNRVDEQWLQTNEYEKEVNKKWIENIEDDLYIREVFLVVSDLINLQKAATKN